MSVQRSAISTNANNVIEPRSCHFGERQRGEIITPVKKIFRFKRFLVSLEMTRAWAVWQSENPCERLALVREARVREA